MAGTAPAPLRHRGRGIARLLSGLVILVVVLAALGLAGVRWLDTDAGRAFVIRQLPLYAPQSGLSVRAGRIEGSIFGAAVIHDLALSDPQGVFAVAPRVALDWRPFDLIANRLTVRELRAAEARLLRRPALRPSADDRILPDIDIGIGRLAIERLVLEAPVTGQRRLLSVGGRADIRAGRALVDLTALTLAAPGRSDTVRLMIDSEPDRDRFDIDATVTGPADGAVAALIGIDEAVDATLAGDGSWTVWRGRLAARLDGASVADLAITGRDGRFTAGGAVRPAPLLNGAAARLAGPELRLDASAEIAARRATVMLALANPALAASARGGIDFGAETFDAVAITARLLRPAAIDPKFTASDARVTGTLRGSFARPVFDWKLSAASLGWGATRATGIGAAGMATLAAARMPVSLRIARVTWLGANVDPLLTGIRVDGSVTIGSGTIAGDALRFRSDRLSGTANARVAGNGDITLGVAGTLPNYAIPGVGIGDIGARLVVASTGAGVSARGPVRVTMRRIDNGSIAQALGGLPVITGDVTVSPDLAVAVANARLASPGLGFVASGRRAADGRLALQGDGVSRDYGPVALTVAGPPGALAIDVALARPGFGVGLVDVRGRLVPSGETFDFDVAAGSDYGPIAARGRLDTRAALSVDLASASIAGVTAAGVVTRTAAGPFAGTLRLTGRGLAGGATLAAVGPMQRNDVQRIDVRVEAVDATLALATPMAVAGGNLRLAVLLPPGGATVTGDFSLRDVERGDTRIDEATGTIAYAGGSGSIRTSLSGISDVPFRLTAEAAIAPGRIAITASGDLDRRRIALSGPAVLTRDARGWALAPFTVTSSDGNAEISGHFGSDIALRARLDRLSLSLLGIAMPRLDFAGRVSGTIDIALPQNGVPSGSAALRLNSLARAGIASSSLPIDVGLNAALGRDGVVARAVIVRGGQVEGRAQARVGPIAAGDAAFIDRLFAAPLAGQIRYAGPAQAIWGLAGLEALDVRGPVAIDAALGGVVGDPKVTGSLAARGGRAELTVLGAVVDQVALDGRFTGARLELTRLSGRVGNNGSITGSGGIDLSAERGFPIDIRLALKNAQLLKRDDVTGTATGNVRIATDIYGGVVSGRLVIDEARYRLGRTAAAEVPVLAVREVNTRVLRRRVARYIAPTRWLLNLDVRGDRRLFVAGMGLESEWQAAVRVRGGLTTPEIFGRVELVRGDYDFAGKRFTLTRGDLRFAGGYPPDPTIDVVATTTQNGFTAQLDIDGTALRPAIAFSSVPSLPEDEVLSRVLFGTSVTDLSAPEAVQLAAALASLRGSGGGFNPINLVRKGLGIDRLRILPADATRGRKTAVAAGQYIGRNVYVELATDASGYTATNIEVSLTRSLSILSEIATLGGQSVNLRWKRDY